MCPVSGAADLIARSAKKRDQKAADDGGEQTRLGTDTRGDCDGHGQGQGHDGHGQTRDGIRVQRRKVVAFTPDGDDLWQKLGLAVWAVGHGTGPFAATRRCLWMRLVNAVETRVAGLEFSEKRASGGDI